MAIQVKNINKKYRKLKKRIKKYVKCNKLKKIKKYKKCKMYKKILKISYNRLK